MRENFTNGSENAERVDEVEMWKDISGYEGRYQISNLGRVKSFSKRANYLKLSKDRKGYPIAYLSSKGKNKIKKVHRLVAIAFIDNPYNLPQVNHKDAIKDNSIYTNLEWCSAKYNTNHARCLGLLKSSLHAVNGSRNGKSKLSDEQVLSIINKRSHSTTKQLSDMYGVSKSGIRSVLSGNTWSHLTGIKKSTFIQQCSQNN